MQSFKTIIYLFLLHGPKLIISVLRNVGKCLIICMYNIWQIQRTYKCTHTCTHAKPRPLPIPRLKTISAMKTRSNTKAARALGASRYQSSINMLTRSFIMPFYFSFPTEWRVEQMVWTSDCFWFQLHLSLKDPAIWTLYKDCEKCRWLLPCVMGLLVPVYVRLTDVCCLIAFFLLILWTSAILRNRT